MFSMKTGQAVSHQPQVVQAQAVSGATASVMGGSLATIASRAAGSLVAAASSTSVGPTWPRCLRMALFTSLWLSGLPVT